VGLLDEIHEFVLSSFEIYHLIRKDVVTSFSDILFDTYQTRLPDLEKTHPNIKEIYEYFLSIYILSYWMNITSLWINHRPNNSNNHTNKIPKKF
jgi:hypothetical protein